MDRRGFVKLSAGAMLAGGFARSLPGLAAGKDPDFQLTASEGDFYFDPEQPKPARVMFFNQSIPGPVIKIPQGRESNIRLHNNLGESTTVHWHGLRIDNAMDGVPDMTQAAVEPGETFDYRLTPPDAGTYWYHSHQRSWAQLALGLAGVLIVEEDDPPVVDQDLVFAIDDWRLTNDLQIDTASLGALHDWAHGGRLGNWATINGEAVETFAVASGERIRLRLLNIANARTMRLRFNQPEISVIAVDGQPVKPFALESGTITLAPGQRSDLIIDMTSKPGTSSPIELLVQGEVYPFANFEFSSSVKRENLLDSPIELPLNPANRIRLPNEFQKVPLYMSGGAMGGMREAVYQGRKMSIQELIQEKQIWALNGVAGFAESPLFKVERGTAVSLQVDNDTAWPHAMHVHGHHFIDGRQPGIWRDTALLARGEKAELKYIADNPGKWLIHCHMIEHQAGGMKTWFEVVK